MLNAVTAPLGLQVPHGGTVSQQMHLLQRMRSCVAYALFPTRISCSGLESLGRRFFQGRDCTTGASSRNWRCCIDRVEQSLVLVEAFFHTVTAPLGLQVPHCAVHCRGRCFWWHFISIFAALSQSRDSPLGLQVPHAGAFCLQLHLDDGYAGRMRFCCNDCVSNLAAVGGVSNATCATGTYSPFLASLAL